MAATDKTNRREEAAEYWAANEITTENSSEAPEDILVRKPLSAMLTLRLSDEDLARLKTAAAAREVGVTTMARMLLHQCLTNPGLQRTRHAIHSKEVEEGLAQVLKEVELPQGDGDTEFLVLSKAHLERINMTLTLAVAGLLFDDLMEQSILVTASQDELFDKLRELSPTS